MGVDRKPSEVFLELWLAATCHACQGEDEFRECAESWFRIRRMEDARKDPSTPLRSAQDDKGADEAAVAPVGISKKETPTEGESTPAAASKIDAEDAVQNGPETDTPFEIRKERLIARVLASKSSVAEIAAAADGVTISGVRDLIDRKKISVARVAMIEKAMDRLEGIG